jgi:murein DD-endopeptidase MepM/ murein hydrolase activator NlpD
VRARFGRPGRRRLAAALAVVASLAVGLGWAFRDDAPPALWIEAPERRAAGAPFELRVSADEPVVYRIRYGARRIERVEQDLRLELTALAGSHPIRIEAADGAGNLAWAARVVEGVPIASADWRLPERLRPGAPFTAELAFRPAGAEAADATLTIGGRPAPLRPREGGGYYAFGAVPLGAEPGVVALTARWRDALGRPASSAAELRHGALAGDVEQLQLTPSTLSLITPEAREREAAALAAARAEPADPPRWGEPFLLPIEGRGTSGFARARRYAPGGPVSFHLGEDIAAPIGTAIRATNAGVVRLAGMYPIKGGLTVIDHGAGVTSRYYHQSALRVEAGDVVRRGQVIGEVGSTGLSTGPHLHWEMRVQGEPTDPLAWVGRVRP